MPGNAWLAPPLYRASITESYALGPPGVRVLWRSGGPPWNPTRDAAARRVSEWTWRVRGLLGPDALDIAAIGLEHYGTSEVIVDLRTCAATDLEALRQTAALVLLAGELGLDPPMHVSSIHREPLRLRRSLTWAFVDPMSHSVYAAAWDVAREQGPAEALGEALADRAVTSPCDPVGRVQWLSLTHGASQLAAVGDPGHPWSPPVPAQRAGAGPGPSAPEVSRRLPPAFGEGPPPATGPPPSTCCAAPAFAGDQGLPKAAPQSLHRFHLPVTLH
jgi:hypothetical protein